MGDGGKEHCRHGPHGPQQRGGDDRLHLHPQAVRRRHGGRRGGLGAAGGPGADHQSAEPQLHHRHRDYHRHNGDRHGSGAHDGL